MEQVMSGANLKIKPDNFVVKKNASDKIIALAGNPNVGKSTLFNALTGLKQHTGNWPGKTVNSAQGHIIYDKRGYVMVDLPGCYSLAVNSAEEEVAGDFICYGQPDAVVVVCDAACLERNLILALQIMEKNKNVVLCINLMDEAKKKRIDVDADMLSKRLGIPVICTAARKKSGINELMAAVKKVTQSSYRADPYKVEYPDLTEMPDQNANDIIANTLVKSAERVCKDVVVYNNPLYTKRDRFIDKLLTSKSTGFITMFIALMTVFWITIVGADYPSDLLYFFFFWIERHLLNFFTFISAPIWIANMLVLGVYRVLVWVVAVMLPPMAIFFPLFTLMEDAGYLPRIAFNLDKAFKKCGACGKQALTMCMVNFRMLY